METKLIAEAIIKVMTEVQIVWKNMTVWSGSNSYEWVADKDVKQAIRASMIKNWLSLLPTGIESKIQIDRWEEVDSYSKETPKAMKTKQSVFTEVDTRYILLHTSGESIELAGYGQGVDTQDKGAGKATTYALKNTLLNMFLIPTGVDTDNTHSDDHEVPKNKTPTAPVKSRPIVNIPTGLELHKCLKCWEDSITKVFEWKYWPCFKCEHCDWYSKPNKQTPKLDPFVSSDNWISLEDIPF